MMELTVLPAEPLEKGKGKESMRLAKPTNILSLIVLIVTFTFSSIAAASLEQRRQQFKSAYELIQSKQDYDLAELEKGLEGYPLYSYLAFAHLSKNIAEKPTKEISAFLKTYKGTPLAKRLRTRWLYSLARQKKWGSFLQQYKNQSGKVLSCYQLQARINTGPVNQALLNDIKKMWLVGKSQVKQCDPAFDVLYKSKAMTSQLVMQRVRLAMQAKNPGLAKFLSKRLNERDRQKVDLWRAVAADPAQQLLDDKLKKDTAFNREVIFHGLKKMTNKDSAAARSLWQRKFVKYKFNKSEKQAMQRELAFTAVQQKHPRAGEWLDALQKQQSGQYIQRYQIRYAAQTQDWKRLQQWTKKPVAPSFNKLRWQYWRARANQEMGNKAAADKDFKALARKRDYYGFLSAEKLGQDYKFSDQRLPLSDAQRTELLTNQGIVRAGELYRLDFYEDARREWTHATNKMNHEQLLQASVLADEWRWHDRTILTLGKAKAYNDLARRFPLPYNATIKHYAKKRGLQASKIYTLMRSEKCLYSRCALACWRDGIDAADACYGQADGEKDRLSVKKHRPALRS